MAADWTSYYYSSPLQQQLIDKDTGLPLAAGVVKFWSDFARTVPKNVYYQTDAGGDPAFTILGINGVVTLSSIGTFVDGSGNNVVPFLWPYIGDPSTVPSTPLPNAEPYYISVYSQSPGLVLQFDVNHWPPNAKSSAASTSGSTTTKVTIYTSGSTTWTKSTNMLYCTLECMGGGGGGGGVVNSTTGNQATGGGGGAGGYSKKTLNTTLIIGPQTVTVGAVGSGGTITPTVGGNGGSSYVGSLCIANGGNGGGSTDGTT